MKKNNKILISFVMAFAFFIAGLFILQEKPVLAASATKISSAKDLLAMEEDPSGDYYLAKDITVPKNTCLFADGTPFMGTLDGKGHKLKGYKSTESPAIFASAKFAAFKNLSVTNVDIKVKGMAAALVGEADTCYFSNVSVSGTIVSDDVYVNEEGSGDVGAIVAYGSGEMEKCKNSAKITAKGREGRLSVNVGGLAGGFNATLLKDCSNSGEIKLISSKKKYVYENGHLKSGYSIRFNEGGLIAGSADEVVSCKNSGNVIMNLRHSSLNKSGYLFGSYGEIWVGGICRQINRSIKSSSNSGKIRVVSGKTSRLSIAYVGGLVSIAYPTEYSAGEGSTPVNCYNTGSVSFSGALDADADEYLSGTGRIGGLFGGVKGVSQCYNTGNVSVTYYSKHRGISNIGGVFGYSWDGNVKNSYNTGNITVINKGKPELKNISVGGVGGCANVLGKSRDNLGNASCNYSVGIVKYTKNDNGGQIIGGWEGPRMAHKSLIYNNYYTTSGNAYGAGDTTWEPFWPTGKKVSAITSGNCPMLSSKYWVYSSKHKRLILKNNREK